MMVLRGFLGSMLLAYPRAAITDKSKGRQVPVLQHHMAAGRPYVRRKNTNVIKDVKINVPVRTQ